MGGQAGPGTPSKALPTIYSNPFKLDQQLQTTWSPPWATNPGLKFQKASVLPEAMLDLGTPGSKIPEGHSDGPEDS